MDRGRAQSQRLNLPQQGAGVRAQAKLFSLGSAIDQELGCLGVPIEHQEPTVVSKFLAAVATTVSRAIRVVVYALEHFSDVLIHERTERGLGLVRTVSGFLELDPEAARAAGLIILGQCSGLPSEPLHGGVALHVVLRPAEEVMERLQAVEDVFEKDVRSSGIQVVVVK